MGANHSATTVTNQLINEHLNDLQCNQGRQVYQFASTDGIDVNARGNCKVNIGNRLSLKSGCDMSAIRNTLTSQVAKEKLEQTAAAGFSFNTKSTRMNNVTKNVEEILLKCENQDEAEQELKNYRKMSIN